jgi:hypothetical protein
MIRICFIMFYHKRHINIYVWERLTLIDIVESIENDDRKKRK